MRAKRRTVEDTLEHALAFVRDLRDCLHFRLETRGILVAVVKLPREGHVLSGDVLSEVAQQLYIDVPMFKALITKSRGRAAYQEAIRARGVFSDG